MGDVKQKPAHNNNMECDEAAYKTAEHEAYKLFNDIRDQCLLSQE